MNPDQTNGLEDIPSFGDPEEEAKADAKWLDSQREAKIDQAYAAYDDARRDMAELDRTRANVEARRRIPIEVETVAAQASSISIEDMATGIKVKVTTKLYAGSPLTAADMDAALEAHAYLHREAEKRAMSGWQETLDVFGRGGK